MSERISQSELESYLWDSAVYLRTNIDAGAYKQYIFPLLFFKRLCDVYDEAYQKALDISGGDEEFARLSSYDFVIPEGSHWKDVRSVSENVGEALVSAFRSIERANPEKLSGIFGSAAWTNKKRLSDSLLKNLIEHFSSQTLSLARCPEDELGHGYEYLIKKFADDSGHTAQEFYTNRTVVHLMTEILQPNEGESVYDPTCGSAGMLISCVHYVKEHGRDARTLAVYGQEFNALTASIARMNLFLHGVKEFEIIQEDTLLHPGFIENGELKRFNVVLANPPYSISEWNREAFASDRYGRNFLGVPPQGRADYAFIQHILKSLDEKNGRCAILLPHGVLFRKEENAIRENLIRSDLIECVIGLGAGLFYNSPMEACILICNTNKPAERRGKILLINAVNEVTKNRSESFLKEEHIEKIADAFFTFEDVENLARVISFDDAKENEFSLALAQYIRPDSNGNEATETVSFDESLQEWMISSRRLRKSFDELKLLLNQKGDC
ncbi:MAG: type I restriction-modification system subunit M [Methanocorpusculum sp.]|nr:type I restriction-modification system subunit M [Methanocorpusculum sp.]HJJ44875.1 class I SAM-dependent DNA methyltransferase [Methanocorpusculum sp.]